MKKFIIIISSSREVGRDSFMLLLQKETPLVARSDGGTVELVACQMALIFLACTLK